MLSVPSSSSRAPSPLKSHSSPVPRNQPCTNCRRSRIKCIWLGNSDTCHNCTGRGLYCSGPQRINTMKCEPCHVAKVKCDWMENLPNFCVRCNRLGKACPGSRAMAVAVIPRDAGSDQNRKEVTEEPEGPIVPYISYNSPQAKIFSSQLCLSLAWHCIQMCFTNQHVDFGGADPGLYMERFRLSRDLSRRSHEPSFYEEILVSLKIFAGATLSNHSALTGGDAPFNALTSPSSLTTPFPTLTNAFPTLSPKRTSALNALSETVVQNTTSFLTIPHEDFQSTLAQLVLVRLVLSKATAVEPEWQTSVCETALRKGLHALKSCSEAERKVLRPLLKNFAFMAVINAASDFHRVLPPLYQSEFDQIFSPPSPLPSPSAAELSLYVFSDTPHSIFWEFVWVRIFREIYNRLAKIFFDLSQPLPKITAQSIWASIDEFKLVKEELFRNLVNHSLVTADGKMNVRSSTIVRSMLAFEAHYWRAATIVRSNLTMKEEDERAVENRWREIVGGISESVELLLSLPILLTRKLEVLNHQIMLLLQFSGSELSTDFLSLSNSARASLLQGIKATELIVKGHTAVQLDALVDLLRATDLTLSFDATATSGSIQVATALLDVLKATSPGTHVTSLWVLVVVPLDGE